MSLRHTQLTIPKKCAGSPVVIFSKGDTLENIAKKHGLKSWKVIWKETANEKVVKLRRDKENLQAGDKLVIPWNDTVTKQVGEAIANYNQTKRAIVAYAKVQEKRIAEIEIEINECYKSVDVLTRRKFDGAKKRKLIDGLVDSTAALERLLSKLPVPSPIETVKFDSIKKLSNGLKRHRRLMNGGEFDDEALENLRRHIGALRAEIQQLQKKINELDNELEEEGGKTIRVFCNAAGVSPEKVPELIKAGRFMRKLFGPVK